MTTKQSKFLQALFTEPSITKASKVARIGRTTAYQYLNDPEFKQELEKHKTECIDGALRFLQGQLSYCAGVLMEIINDPLTKDQVKINAIQLVFNQCKSMTETSELLKMMPEVERFSEWLDKEGS